MALRDHEQHQLDEIERRLARENPRLARRFEKFRPMPAITFAAAALGVLSVFLTGLVALVVGFGMGSAPPIAVGAVLTTAVPLAIIWFYRCHWR
ncbi:DUF3040 domain-containing protein [Amycolatopsis sp. NPDC054798]